MPLPATPLRTLGPDEPAPFAGSDLDRSLLLSDWMLVLRREAPALGLSPRDLIDMEADAESFQLLIEAHLAAKENARNWQAFKRHLLRGDPHEFRPAPTAPEMTQLPERVLEAGLLRRMAWWIARVEALAKKNQLSLSLLEEVQAAFAPDLPQPQLIVCRDISGYVEVVWCQGPWDGIRIEVDRGDGFRFLAVDTVPNFIDTYPRHRSGTSGVWTYRGIYIQADEPVGLWSEPTRMIFKR